MDHERHHRHDRDRDGRQRSRSKSASRGDDDHQDSNQRRSNKGKGGRHHSRDHSSKRHKKDKHRRDYNYESSGESSHVSSSSSKSSRSARGKHHSKKKHRKEKKKKHKKKKDRKHSSKKKSRRHESRSRSPSNSPPATASIAAPPGAHELASALTQLFDSYPAMTSLDEGGIPLLFIQLSRGTEYNLSQMPDRNLAGLLEVVFEAMSIHGMEVGGNGAWKWGNAPKGGQQKGNDLALLRLTRALLIGVGFTMDSVEQYEQDQMQKLKQLQQQERQQEAQHMNEEAKVKEIAMRNAEKAEENENNIRHRKRVERMTSQMLDRFDPKNSSSSASSLSNELQGICDVLMEGESVQLDGIENGKLKATLGQLFQLIGLDLVEMDEEEDEEGDIENGNNEEKIMGYALPDISGIRDTVSSNVNEVLRVCRFRSSGGSECAPALWAAKPTIPMEKGQAQEESSSDDDDGPAPLGTVAAVKISKRKRTTQVQKNAMAGEIEEGGREEWMMVPGEHDFLKGIAKSTSSRTFKNEKQRGQCIPASAHGNSAEPINPKVLEEVNAIQRAYEESRGPSLLDAHRQKLQESKRLPPGQKEDYKWSREKNLDDGRRVDKNALHQVLGGASTELRSKFQGSLGR
mmetsp:Transcript_8017/g.18099  ORF Transcript_8017/g.18099 Transcript_8017/m.18099 type:complete len:630 (-) Transcript_8017:1145-3034(-)